MTYVVRWMYLRLFVGGHPQTHHEDKSVDTLQRRLSLLWQLKTHVLVGSETTSIQPESLSTEG